jgi:hypothetical protein
VLPPLKIPCPHAHVAASKAGVDLLSIISSGWKTAHLKQQYQGVGFSRPSNAQIEARADLYGEAICLHQTLKRPNGRPNSVKRKAGYLEKQGKKRIFTCQVGYKVGQNKKTCLNRAFAGGPAPWGTNTQISTVVRRGKAKKTLWAVPKINSACMHQ